MSWSLIGEVFSKRLLPEYQESYSVNSLSWSYEALPGSPTLPTAIREVSGSLGIHPRSYLLDTLRGFGAQAEWALSEAREEESIAFAWFDSSTEEKSPGICFFLAVSDEIWPVIKSNIDLAFEQRMNLSVNAVGEICDIKDENKTYQRSLRQFYNGEILALISPTLDLHANGD